MNCESISMQRNKVLVDDESNQNMGQLLSAVKALFYWFSLRVVMNQHLVIVLHLSASL